MQHDLSRSTALALSMLALAACTPATPAPLALTAPASTAAGQVDLADAELLARGEYLVRIAGCNVCHTPDYGDRAGDVPREEWLVGSPVGFSGPWGTTYAGNLRMKAAEMDEAGWMEYTGDLHTRPTMPDFAVRAMHEEDRRALYRFIRALGPGGGKAPDYLPPGVTPPPPHFQLVLPPAPPQAPAAPTGG